MSKPNSEFKVLATDTSKGQFDDLEFGKWKSKWLNIQQIYTGVDSFEFRIWNSGMWSPAELVILRYFDSKWIVCNYTHVANGKNVIDSLKVFCKQIDPTIALKIENYFIQDSILTLPSQTAIPKFIDNTADGDTYFIEIATKKFYKTLRYHNPQYFSDQYNQQFVRIIHFLEPHLKFFHTLQ